MKNERLKGLVVMLICLIISSVNGQVVQIVNGNKSKVIESENVVKIAIGEVNEAKDHWVSREVIGNILVITKDSVLVNVSDIKVSTLKDGQKTQNTYNWGGEYKPHSFAQADVNYLSKYKSKKGKKVHRRMTIFSGLLFVGGAITGLSALVVKDKESRKNILKLGAAEMGAGILLGLSLNKKKYKFKNTDDPWRFEG